MTVVVVVAEGVVALEVELVETELSARPPVSPMFSVLSSDCSCLEIQLRTIGVFS